MKFTVIAKLLFESGPEQGVSLTYVGEMHLKFVSTYILIDSSSHSVEPFLLKVVDTVAYLIEGKAGIVDDHAIGIIFVEPIMSTEHRLNELARILEGREWERLEGDPFKGDPCVLHKPETYLKVIRARNARVSHPG